MKQINDYKDKNVLVFGAGLSGTNAAKLLIKLGANVTLTDAKPASEIADFDELVKAGVKVVAGKSPLSLLDNVDLMIKNPGINYDVPLVKAAEDKKIPVIVEIELAGEIANAKLIGVTGSNGKTTTTTMIAEMLNAGNEKGKAYRAGNIGISATKVAEKATSNDEIVMELSSFMLLGITTLHPHIAVVTNIFENHLDYHKTRENYINAKMQITKNQTADDYLVMNFDREEWRKLSKRSKARVVPFSVKGNYEDGAYQHDGKLYFRDEYIMKAKDIRIPGEQNVENALAAIAVARLSGVSATEIVKVLKNFGGVRHRNQFVLSSNGRDFYNDSKATDIEATQMAIEGFKKPIILLAGGLDRGYTFEKLEPDFKKHLNGIVLFGETAQLLKDSAQKAGVPQIKVVDNLDEAVPVAYEMSKPGEIVLLSPANASWDQFPSFEIRGDQYIKDVEKLTGKKEE
ncbi:UDP-N-acetylmuramoyl-L-alanine--D-glutamate ligase [Lactobacillus sanfranciscensis]|uniref:UDP-N-acetylmuramoylalanine--D-glutamate ligase n=1 Tax=Fructilactobacillus sanfranciscensis (strain TMW 1.1304) TaxID=714313 RepID=G2KUF8_FRUST|nr:UDP-N-acetylmuramoyl-L-alanine--D-glutamate ligase [Fructilactobacillus sanfranciscensis]AEN99412.1 UDP-N-acetylmuramoylalanine--D-glutamate ligase [Fructilactobacillus sanfranciscensis TMW 1.1304]NDR75467.1 UDP-N-acetylmuramoyl-L-alanine--D-glutamate ligase [Fructilactobacillus sanfranciscensis]NDR95957.1 UDP-N-acetylmuramoyl-L-alanine--D-glutamate ligase [Fructilactobacillus sanfranciscensis]NDS03824.1 UDP-N-acetylmuramoyl-L-alanine--D-glutamate ligase [Fructilactobacillus sanfranciscensis